MSRYHTGNIQPQLDLEEHNGDAKAKNVSIRGLNAGGTQYNNAIVDDSGALKVTGGGGGGGGTVDQGVAGTDPWLMAIDQTGTNNNVEAACTQVTSPWVVSGTVTTGGLTDTELRATPVPISGTVTIQDGGNTITVDGTVAVTQSTSPWVVGDGGSSITVDQSTHDNLNLNANLQVANADVANGNPVPVSDAGGTLTVDQPTAANLNATVVQATAANLNCTADTELPAAVALSDALSNPTAPAVGSYGLRWDGTQWTRAQLYFYQNRTGAGNTSGAGTAIDMTANAMSKFGLQVENGTGTTSAWNINLEGSMDNASWFTLLNQTNATGTAQLSFVADKPVRYCRSNVTSVNGGGTVRIRIIAVEH